MDKMQIRIKKIGDCHADVVEIYINGRNLKDIVKEIELPFAIKEGHPDIAGSYEGLVKDVILYPSKHLLGEPNESLVYDGKVTILDCECGCYGCWSLVVKISFDGEKKVVWSDFEQIHRKKDSVAGEWNYNTLKPLIFERNEYERELKKYCECNK